MQIHKLLQNKEHWAVRHILKEANHVDDRIVKTEHMILATAPIKFLEVLDSDKTSSAFDIINLI